MILRVPDELQPADKATYEWFVRQLSKLRMVVEHADGVVIYEGGIIVAGTWGDKHMIRVKK